MLALKHPHQTLSLRWLLASLLVWLGSLMQCNELQAQAEQDTDRASEAWYGTLDAGLRHFRFFIQLQRTEDAWTGTLSSLDEGGAKFSLDDLQRSDNELRFELKVSAATYNGKLDPSGQFIEGRWQQRTADLPFRLERVDELPDDPLMAVWSGQIKTLFQTLDVQFREMGTGQVYMDSISQKAGGFVAEKKIDEDEIVFIVEGVKGRFEGTLDEDRTTATGTWKQGLLPVALELKRSKSPIAVKPRPRPQTPLPPFPYSIEEVTFENRPANVRLAGTLTVPESDGPFPAVILVSGSGPQDRDESLLDHKPFWVIADYLSRRGIAVLRYDDRGVGESTGDFATANTQDLAGDAEAAFVFLQSHRRVAPNEIGICGHSEGGLIAPMVAATNKSVAFIILLAGPGVNGEKILKSQTKLILAAQGADDAEIARQAAMQAIMIELAKQSPSPTTEQFIGQAVSQLEKHLTEQERASNSAEQMARSAASQLLNPWFQFFMRHEPLPVLEKVACPVLAMNGEKDLQVAPDLNLPQIRTALQRGSSEDFEVQELSGLNHLFQPCQSGLMSEYAEIAVTFDQHTMSLMSDWVLEQCKE